MPDTNCFILNTDSTAGCITYPYSATTSNANTAYIVLPFFQPLIASSGDSFIVTYIIERNDDVSTTKDENNQSPHSKDALAKYRLKNKMK